MRENIILSQLPVKGNIPVCELQQTVYEPFKLCNFTTVNAYGGVEVFRLHRMIMIVCYLWREIEDVFQD